MKKPGLFIIFIFMMNLSHTVTAASEGTVEPTDSPRFSYASARAAFAEGKAPSAITIEGRWSVVGNANLPNISANFPSGYWPDGKILHPGYSRSIKYFRHFAAQTDAFGNRILVSADKIVDAVTGRVRNEGGNYVWNFSSAGLRAGIPETDATCAESVACKMIPEKEMLLCATMITSASCGAGFVGKIVSYTGFLKLP